MRWALWICGLSACDAAWCPPRIEGVGDPPACALEHERCDRDTRCAGSLECVPAMMCTVGPCPGFCLAPCGDDEDCGPDEACASSEYTAPDETFCVPAG